MTKSKLDSSNQLEENWKNAAGIVAIATSAIFTHAGQSAPVIWR